MTTKNKLPKILVIIGPNASGKSDLAVKIASKIGGEIISADSRQVYRGLDIGSGKITQNEMRGIPHHLLDVASPNADFNVAHFQKIAAKKIAEIVGRDKVPIIVGGTGFWIDSFLYGWHLPNVKPNLKLRARLERQSAGRLFARLNKLDPVRANSIDRYNKRRLVRALEIMLLTGEPVPAWSVSEQYAKMSKRTNIGGADYQVHILGIKWPKQELQRRIHSRLVKRLKAGMIKEIKKLHESGVSWKRLDGFGLEYRYVSRYVRSLISYDEMLGQLFGVIKKYARRQMRWFKRNKQIRWASINEFKKPTFIKNLVNRFSA